MFFFLLPCQSIDVLSRFIYTALCINPHTFTVLQLLMEPGNTKGGSITVPLTSCLTGLESAE
jgi:hypothetical protein